MVGSLWRRAPLAVFAAVGGLSYALAGPFLPIGKETIVVTSVLDNLLKGAAGGTIQWLNRLLGLAETEGLSAPAPGWT